MKEMLRHLIFLMPTAISLIYFLRFVTSKSKHRSLHMLTILSFVSALFFFSDATYYSSCEDYKALVIGDVIGSYTGPMMPALAMLMLRSIIYDKYTRWYSFIALLIVPCILGTMTLTIYIMKGMEVSASYLKTLDVIRPSCWELMYSEDRAAAVHFWVNIIGYYSVMVVLCVCIMWQVVYYMRSTRLQMSEVKNFVLGKCELEPFHVEGILLLALICVFLVRIGIYRSYIMDHQWVAVMFSLVISWFVWMIFRVGVLVDKATIVIRCKEHPEDLESLYSQEQSECSDNHELAECLEQSADKVSYIEMIDCEDRNELLQSIYVLMEDDKPFLSPTLTIEDVAHSLCTNKSYVSKCINANMHLTFRDYINTLRIDHAKQMMLSHPDRVQEEIASMSGFYDASQFNKKFKQIVGATPRQWMLKQKGLYI